MTEFAIDPVFLDLHIHTSEDPTSLNPNYDINELVKGIGKLTSNGDFLISLTDHNTINKAAYLSSLKKVENIILGVELHVRNFDASPPYHCHIYFNVKEITDSIIDDINSELDILYPNKIVSNSDTSIPKLEAIIKAFDLYDFLLLPHGGQSHSTFDKSIPDGVKFDTMIERSIYYNQFDGFTARGNARLERTQEYFKKLGINEFVNLITCTDNYHPKNYPNSKGKDANPFVPTWMFARPTFSGLRLSLSESSRLIYSDVKPIVWSEHIRTVVLKNEKIDIEVTLTPGLNVVIGGSSSGKTLFVDTIFRKISNEFEGSSYEAFGVQDIKVDNPSNLKPHYLSQNYIMKVVSENSEDGINSIEIIKNVFPGDESIKKKVDRGLAKLRSDLHELIQSVKEIEEQTTTLTRIPQLGSLITKASTNENILGLLLPTEEETLLFQYPAETYQDDLEYLQSLDLRLKTHPFIEYDSSLIKKLTKLIERAFSTSTMAEKTQQIIESDKKNYDAILRSSNAEEQTKKQNFDKLLDCVKSYSRAYLAFNASLKKLSTYSLQCDSEKVDSMGHTLFIENNFKLNKEKLLETINHYLKTGLKIESFDNIQVEDLFSSNFKKSSPKVHSYDDFESKITSDFEAMNRKEYKIITSTGRKFEDLSAGWKTSIILDLILGFEGDIAPIIIDQPEDNLATNYINTGLVKAIKATKSKKQIILVSHNATIPMLGDAQNIILCKSKPNSIEIRSNRLEGEINNQTVVDHIAEITDGGKSSIRKRVKKYNLKNFKDLPNEIDIQED